MTGDLLNFLIRDFYDQSTRIWLDTWGEHMHHGYYGPNGDERKNHQQAQVDLVETLLSWGEVTGAKRILDAGCGVGGSSRYLTKKFGATSYGITLSPVQAENAAKFNEKSGLADAVKIEARDMMTLNEADGQFDLVWSMESAEHIRDKQRLFQMFMERLAPGGTLLMATWCHRPTPPGLSAKEELLLEKIYKLYHLPPMVPRETLVEMATTAGFTAVKSEDWSKSVAPFWLAVLRSAMSLKSVIGLIRSGLPTLKGAWAMRYMIKGYRMGLIEFVVVRGRKAN